MAEKEYLNDDELELVTGGTNNTVYKTGDKIIYKYGKNVTKSSTINSIVGNVVHMANGDTITKSDILGLAGESAVI